MAVVRAYKYKLQGDGRNSWICTETDGIMLNKEGKPILDKEGYEIPFIVNKYMVYEDPEKRHDTIDLLNTLKACTPEEIATIKQLLK